MTRDRLKRSIVSAYATIGLLIVFGSTSCGVPSKTVEPQALPDSKKTQIRPLTDVVFERTELRLKRGKYLAGSLSAAIVT
jgi:hypothetical protein